MKKNPPSQKDSELKIESRNISLLDDAQFIEDLRHQMIKFSTLQLNDPQLAEDTVQEALVGALKNASSFGGRAALKTWIFAILRNKIIDVFRQRKRMANFSELLQKEKENEEEDFSVLFDNKGHWQVNERPTAWANPEESMKNVQFWRVFETCLEKLPGNQARVFMMREFIGLDSGEICVAANITNSNLGAMLHRARTRLRGCLENRWFGENN